jgi:membrane protein
MTSTATDAETRPPVASGAPRAPSGRSGGRGWFRLLLNTYREIGADHIGLIAAGIGFYGLLAIFPALVAVMAIAGLVMDPAFVVTQLEGLARVLPQEAATIIIDQAVAVTGSQSGGLGLAAILGLLIALYSASKGVTSLIEGLNVAFEVEERRGYVKYYLVVFGLTLGVIVAFLVVAGLLAVLPAVLAVVGGGFGETLATWLRWPVVAGVVILGLAVLYKYAPSRGDVPWRWVTPGAVVATVLWLVGSVLFTVYVANFGSYNETFGTLGGVIVLLTWLWLSAYIVLMGAELDSEIERQDKLPGGSATPSEKAEARPKP